MMMGVNPTSTRAESQTSAPLHGARVLVVDDQEDARELVARVLEGAGAEVSQADSAEAAMRALESARPFAALVSDIGMPIADGYELIRRIRGAGVALRDLPAIAVTAFCTPGDQAKARSAGFQEHFAKPFDPNALVESVARLVARV